MLEFQTFLAEGKFSRHHFASIQTQLFDSSFCLNGIYLNVGKLLNREIIVDYEGPNSMPWLHKIDPKFYYKITKLVQFYFQSQYLHINRYLLCKELSLKKMKNMVIGFSDGSKHFASSVIYLVSYNPNSSEYAVNMVSSLFRLGAITKDNGEDNDSNTMPKRECHGLFLAVCGVSNLANFLYKIKVPLTKVYVFCDAIAHIIALRRSPACFKAPFNKWYAEINSLTYQIGNLTLQPKEEIVQFLQQKVYSTPADLLTKFD